MAICMLRWGSRDVEAPPGWVASLMLSMGWLCVLQARSGSTLRSKAITQNTGLAV
jgi:hypothetical protein